MSWTRTRWVVVLSLFLAVTMLAPAASADPDGFIGRPDDGLEAGGSEGVAAASAHAPPTAVISTGASSEGLPLEGRGARIEANATTDVWAHDEYAYTGTFNSPCGGEPGAGIWVWDVDDADDPVNVGVIASPTGSRTNDVKVAEMNSGDILVHSNESCDGGPGGFEIYDVDDPEEPEHLASVRSDDVNATINADPVLGPFVQDAGVHNLWLFTQGDRDYVAAVFETWFGNFQIWDITDPAAPVLAGTWGAEFLCDPALSDCSADPHNETDPALLFNEVVDWMLGGFGASSNRLLHDVTLDAGGTLAYLSNWDAGLVLLDVSDPANPVFISTALDPVNGSLDGEVNSHAAWPNEDGTVVVETEEDFSVFASLEPFAGTFGEVPSNTIPGVGTHTRAGDAFEENQTGNNVTVAADAITVNSGPLAGQTYPALEFFGSQPALDTLVGGSVTGDAVWIGLACDDATTENAGAFTGGEIAIARRGDCLFATKLASAAALGASAIVITNNVADTVWGGVRIWDYSDPSNPVLASTFDTVCSADPTDPICEPGGTYSVHNVVVEDGKAYISWYWDGALVLDISDPYDPVEIARFDDASTNGGLPIDFWGIYKEPGEDEIYVSDRNGGLYIFEDETDDLDDDEDVDDDDDVDDDEDVDDDVDDDEDVDDEEDDD